MPARAKRPTAKNDPKLVAAARELRDRYLEQLNRDPAALAGEGKYDVGRQIATADAGPAPANRPSPLLPAPAPGRGARAHGTRAA